MSHLPLGRDLADVTDDEIRRRIGNCLHELNFLTRLAAARKITVSLDLVEVKGNPRWPNGWTRVVAPDLDP